jgi:hypothetical protein
MNELAQFLNRVSWRRRVLVCEGILVSLLLSSSAAGSIYSAAVGSWSAAIGWAGVTCTFLLFLSILRSAWTMLNVEERILREKGVDALMAFRKENPAFDVLGQWRENRQAARNSAPRSDSVSTPPSEPRR